MQNKIKVSLSVIISLIILFSNVVQAQDFNVELEKDVKHPISVRAGLEYSFYDFLDLRAGVGSEPTSFSGGIGLNYDMFQLDYALYYSPDLGITHQGTISINFGGEKGRQESRDQLRKAFE